MVGKADYEHRRDAMKPVLSVLLSLALGIFLADAVVSLLDDTLMVCFDIHALGLIRGSLFFLAILTAMVIYLSLGITPLIPKRFFLPMALFYPAATFATIPISIYQYDRLPQITWVISFCQVLTGLFILYWVQGGLRFRWPIVREEQFGKNSFGWLNLSGFVLVNVFLLLPGILIYLAFCASLAMDHFTGSFLALRPDGLVMRARTYVRDDHKTIRLIPMMHIGEADFYDKILKSFPTNSVILLEGVSDNRNLLQHKVNYKRMAKSLGLAEQQEEFSPPQGTARPADIDVDQFSKRSIEFLNLVTLIHSQGLSLEALFDVMQKSQDPQLAEQLWEDLLTKRNSHLLQEIRAELPRANTIVVPWGAAHMRGIAEEIQKSGFHVSETHEYTVLYFRSIWNRLFHSRPK